MDKKEIVNGMREAAERMGLDLEDLQEMIEDVLEDCSAKSQLLMEAADAGDAAQIKALAHDIKGATANYGLSGASALALKIEKGHEEIPKEAIAELGDHLKVLSTLNLDQAE